MVQFKIKTIAVVGASSQIGKALLPRLKTEGYLVYQIGRENRSAAEGNITYVFDETRGNFVPKLDTVDAVINLAPLPSIGVVVEMACVLNARRIIAFGSMGRFSKLGSTSAIEQDFVLQQERAECLLSIACEAAGIGWTLFRPTMIYGADVDLNISFIKKIINKFGFFPIPIGANGLRQPVHIDDLANACVAVLSINKSINKSYNLGGGEVLSFSSLVSKIFKTVGKAPIIVPIPKILFFLLIIIVKKLFKFDFIRSEMVDRLYQDFIVDNQPAVNDFGYAPKSFCLHKSN